MSQRQLRVCSVIGFGPISYSLGAALMPNHNEAGAFFGSLAVISALSFVYVTLRCRPVTDPVNIRTFIIGPALFGFTFMISVGTFPKAIFVLSAVVIFLGIICLALVRLP